MPCDVSDGLWNVRDVRCSGCGMSGMWNVGDGGYSRCEMLGDVGDVGCSRYGMFWMWDVRDVGCSGCGMFKIWNVGCGMFAGMWATGLPNAIIYCC